MSNKVLFVAYHFPPDAEVGALRSQKFVKYLQEHDWQPFVLTIEDSHYLLRDPQRLKDVNGAIVERTAFWRTPLQLLIDFRDYRIRGWSTQKQAAKVDIMTFERSLKFKKMPFLKRFLVALNHTPDDKLCWLFPAFFKGIRFIKNNDIRLIVVSSPPRSSIILAYLLAVHTGAKLVLDYRDPWSLREDRVYEHYKPHILLAFERSLEKRILKRASAILITNEFYHNALFKEFPLLEKDKIHVIHNGFDSSDFPDIESDINVGSCTGKYIVSYVVSYYMQQTPADLLKALSLFLHERGLNEADIEMRFIGELRSEWVLPVEKTARDEGLRKVVKITGRVVYAQALKLMRESNLLVLTCPDRPLQIPAKTYEYLGTSRPILALLYPGATTALIESINAGICVKPSNIEGIKQALDVLYDNHLNGNPSYEYDATVFERRNQAACLAKILAKVCDSILCNDEPLEFGELQNKSTVTRQSL